MVVSFLGGSINVLLAPSLSSGSEERYLSHDCHYAIDLDWEHRWLYVPNNERPPLLTFSHDLLYPDMIESWSRPPALLKLQHLRFIARCDRGSKGLGTNNAEGDPYLLQPLGPPLKDERPPLVGVLGRNGPYNRVECPHPHGGGRRSNDDSY